MATKRNAPDPCPSARGHKEATLGPTISRGPAKNVYVCVLIQRAEQPSKTATRLPGKTSSAGVRLLHPARLKRKRTAFFGPACPLSRPRRRANNPGSPRSPSNAHRPRPSTTPRSARTGPIDRSRAQVPHPLKSAGSDAQGAQARCVLEYMGVCGTRRIRFRNLRRAAQYHGRKSGQGAVC